MILVVAGVSYLTGQNYSGTINVYDDFNGDGTVDVVEVFGDSIKVYDGVSSTLLGKYTGDGTFTPLEIVKLRDNRVAVSYSSYSNWKFEVYEDLSTPVYSSDTFPVSPGNYLDYNGDGTIDIGFNYGDSLVIYDGNANSPTKIHTYVPDPGYTVGVALGLTDSAVLILYDSATIVNFKIYENLSNLVYTSPDHFYDTYYSVYPMDYNGDGRIDIVLDIVILGNRSRLTVYSTPYDVSVDEVLPEKGLPPVSTVAKGGYLALGEKARGETTVEIYDLTGRLRMRTLVPEGENRVPVRLPSGIYSFVIRTPKGVKQGRFINLR